MRRAVGLFVFALSATAGCERHATAPVTHRLVLLSSDNASAALFPGQRFRTWASVVTALGDTVSTAPAFSLISTDTTKVAIDSGRIIVARAATPGTLVVAHATYGSEQLSDSLTVVTFCSTGIFVGVSPTSISLAIGETSAPVTVTYWACGAPIDDTILWIVADGSVVSVDPAARTITGLKAGQTTVQVKPSHSSPIGTISVTVR